MLHSLQNLWPSPVRRRRWQPLCTGAVVFSLILAVWELGLAPLLPTDPNRVDHIGEGPGWRPEDPSKVLFAARDPAVSELLIVGDSRVFHGIVDRVLERAGLGRTVVLWGQGAQLLEELEFVRTLPPRRIVIHLDPSAIYAEAPPWAMAAWAERDSVKEQPWTTERVDRTLSSGFRRLRGEYLTVIRTRAWRTHWFYELDPNAHNLVLRKRLRPETRPTRSKRLKELQSLLSAMLEEHWEIVALRLPISPSLARIEEQAMPSEVLRELCAGLKIPYLDYFGRVAQTMDGSHLTYTAALGMSEILARDLTGIWPRVLAHTPISTVPPTK